MITVQLIVVQGKPEGKTIPITGPIFRVGRDPSCHLRPSSDQVSRLHAELAITSETVIVKDLGSRNGTFLNGRTLSGPAQVKSGDLVKIGHLTFAVSIQGVPEARPEAGPRPVNTTTPSLDEVPQETVEAWLIADNERPIPDRPSGVYDGDTITINAYKETKSGSKPPSSRELPTAATTEPADSSTPEPRPPSSREVPVARAPEPSKPRAVAPKSESGSETPSYLQDVEFGDVAEGSDVAPREEPEDRVTEDEELEVEDDSPAEDELIDESNPFYAARKSAAVGEAAQASKVDHKDSSDAARDILNRMLERRRNR